MIIINFNSKLTVIIIHINLNLYTQLQCVYIEVHCLSHTVPHLPFILEHTSNGPFLELPPTNLGFPALQ